MKKLVYFLVLLISCSSPPKPVADKHAANSEPCDDYIILRLPHNFADQNVDDSHTLNKDAEDTQAKVEQLLKDIKKDIEETELLLREIEKTSEENSGR